MTRDELIRRFIDNGRRAQAAVNFEIAKAELRKLGIALWQRPGEYLVNLADGLDENALTAETLDEAVQLGLDMAKTVAPTAPAATSTAPGKKYRHPRRMTPKAMRRRMIRAHNRGRARAINPKNTGNKK